MSSGSSTSSSSGSRSSRSGDGQTTTTRLTLRPLQAAGISLFVAYACLGLAPFTAPALLNPAWQLRLASNLISNGYLTLLGLGCFYMDKYLSGRTTAPSRPSSADSSTALARWAVAASLGFVLLVPLQAAAVGTLIANNFSQLNGRSRTPNEMLGAMEKIIKDAPDTSTLQERLAAMRGPTLAPADLGKPLPELKAALLNSLKQAQDTVKVRTRQESSRRAYLVIFDCLRMSVMTIAYAMGHAAFGQRPGQRRTFLEEIVSLTGLGGRRQMRVGGY